MNAVLYLTTDEKKLFEKLSGELKEGWTVQDEKLTSYETPTVLKMRADMAYFKTDKELVTLGKDLQKNADLKDLPDLSEAAMLEFFFCIGAQGMSAFIDQLLRETTSDDDIQGLAYLSTMRHRMLVINSSTPPSA